MATVAKMYIAMEYNKARPKGFELSKGFECLVNLLALWYKQRTIIQVSQVQGDLNGIIVTFQKTIG